jgi:signal transduction histidine kinase
MRENNGSTTSEAYATVVSRALDAAQVELSVRWLARLNEILEVSADQVFPSDQLLDHIPALIAEIAGYLRAPADEEIAANTSVIEKARELGELRYTQRASVHQLLREYELLGELLEGFVESETLSRQLQPTAFECLEVVRRLTRAIRTLMRTTVDTFVDQYMRAIRDRNDRIAQFNRMASHEFRTPIGTLTFAAELLSHETVRTDAVKLDQVLGIVGNNIKRLAWLINNLQRLARVDGTVDVPTQQRVEMSSLATEVARQLSDMAIARGVDIEVEPGLPLLLTDPARIELILLNLVSNAIKYSDPAKPRRLVEIRGQAAVDESGGWRFHVRDNGIGIPAEARDAIFERFFRAHAHLDEALSVHGSGLGLSIVADCVKALDGSVEYDSEPGVGTEFRVWIPNVTPDPDPAH